MPIRKRLGSSDHLEDTMTTEEKLRNLESEYNELNTELTRSFEEFTEKELDMLRNNTHPGIKDRLEKLLHNIEQSVLLFRSRRDIEIEKVLKEFEAAKEAIMSESRALEQELACSLQKSLLNQLEELNSQEQHEDPLVLDSPLSNVYQSTIISCTLTPAEINHDLTTMKTRMETMNPFSESGPSLYSVSFDNDKLLYADEIFCTGETIRVEHSVSDCIPMGVFNAIIKSIQDKECRLTRNNDLITINNYQLETGQYTLRHIDNA